MKQTIKTAAFFFITVIAANAAMAQQGVEININYNTATPLGSSFRDYVNKTSFRGSGGSVLYRINDHFKAGLQVSYNDYYQKYGRQVYKGSDGADISTVLTNTLQSVPLLAKAEYSFLNTAFIKTYIGLGAGVHFINYDQYVGGFEYQQFYTKAAFTGDAGIMIPLHRNSGYGLKIGTSYNLMPYKEEGISHLDSWNVQAGVSIPLRK